MDDTIEKNALAEEEKRRKDMEERAKAMTIDGTGNSAKPRVDVVFIVYLKMDGFHKGLAFVDDTNCIAVKVPNLGWKDVNIAEMFEKKTGIRAAVLSDEFSAAACSAHNDANVLCLGGRVVSPEKAVKLVDLWLTTPFEGDRHVRRLAMIADLDERK